MALQVVILLVYRTGVPVLVFIHSDCVRHPPREELLTVKHRSILMVNATHSILFARFPLRLLRQNCLPLPRVYHRVRTQRIDAATLRNTPLLTEQRHSCCRAAAV